MPVTSAYNGSKDFQRLVVTTPGVPNEVTAVIENTLEARPNDTVSLTEAVYSSTKLNFPLQPENDHSLLTNSHTVLSLHIH